MKQQTDVIVTVSILLALLAAVAPHVPDLPGWIVLWCLCFWGYMLLRVKTGWPLPGRRIRFVLVCIGLAGLMATYRVRLGSDAFVGLMAIMAAIKPLEMGSHRHRMVTILLTYFIIITSLLRSDSLWIILYMFFSVFVTTVALVRINHPKGRFRASFNMAARILMQAIPLMILLFLLFPRLQGSVVGIRDTRAGISGFSEILSPGSVSRLSTDPTPAFRAEFENRLPPADALYWRGIVFDVFKDNSWRPQKHAKSAPDTDKTDNTGFSHTVILEPHKSKWLIALDRPVRSSNGTFLTPAGTVRSVVPVRKTKTYQVVSAPDALLKNDVAPVPVSIGKENNPRTRQLARNLTEDVSGSQAKLERLLAYFKENPFAYSLTPPQAPPHNSIDSFLLDSRTGYCEHYASALAFMLNAVGIPARIVGGFLGAEFNPYGNFLIVRQSLAHAWVEVYLPDTGWKRVDPTLVVSSERLRQSPDGSRLYAGDHSARPSLMNKIQLFLDTVNVKWEAWFIGYSYSVQKAILEKLGFGERLNTATVVAVFLVLACLVLLGFFLFFRLHRQWGKKKKDPVKAAYLLFCTRMARIGIPKASHQGPKDYVTAIKQKRPDLKAEVDAVTDLYIRLRFQERIDQELAATLAERVKRFKPTRHH